MADVIQISPVFHERPFAVPGANPDSMLSPVQFSYDTSPFVLELCLTFWHYKTFQAGLALPPPHLWNQPFFQKHRFLSMGMENDGGSQCVPDLGVIISRPFQRKELRTAVAALGIRRLP